MEFFTHATALAALAVVAIQQILKLKFIPVDFANKYPVPTNILLSIAASLYVVWQSNVPTPHVWTSWVQLVATIAVTAALTYNMLLKNWSELRATEGTRNQ